MNRIQKREKASQVKEAFLEKFPNQRTHFYILPLTKVPKNPVKIHFPERGHGWWYMGRNGAVYSSRASREIQIDLLDGWGYYDNVREHAHALKEFGMIPAEVYEWLCTYKWRIDQEDSRQRSWDRFVKDAIEDFGITLTQGQQRIGKRYVAEGKKK